MFKYIELFAGIGGFRQALDSLGGECVFASEIDPFATKAYKALYNGASELNGDITKVEAHDIPDHDVLVGGFPCQAFSIAGQRKGFEEARGTLFFEIARIASAKQPRLMLLENVKGLLSHDGGRTFETMCVVLNDIGYAIDFRVLNSKHYGVPQNRERIFVACERDAEHADWNVNGTGVEAKAKRRAQELGIRTFNFNWPANNDVVTRLRDVLETNVDEKYYLSEEKTAKLIAQLGERLDSAEPIVHSSLNHYGNDQMNRVYSIDGVAPTITVVSGGGREQKIAVPIIEKVGHLPSDSGQTGAVYGVDGIAPTCLNQHGNAVTKVAELQQYSDGSGISYTVDANYAKGTSPGDIGKGRRTHVMEGTLFNDSGQSRRLVVNNELAPTLRVGGGGNKPGIWRVEESAPRYRIRKLTPLECWRLQGFSDESHNTVAAAGISDSQRYKQAGNAVTVNVISAIGRRLIPLLTEVNV